MSASKGPEERPIRRKGERWRGRGILELRWNVEKEEMAGGKAYSSAGHQGLKVSRKARTGLGGSDPCLCPSPGPPFPRDSPELPLLQASGPGLILSWGTGSSATASASS